MGEDRFMEVIDIENKRYWNDIIKTFEHPDVYFTCEYNVALMLHGDGQPQLIYFEYQNVRIAYVMFKNDITELKVYHNVLAKGKYYDWTSPYGYGGPLVEGEVTNSVIEHFKSELFAYCAKHNIVTQFFRFHSLLQNHKEFESICELKCLKKTVAIDVSDYDNIDYNMTSECRNRVRKAEKNNISIFWDKGARLDDFLHIYNMTMQYHQAELYYYFKKEYFSYLIENMQDNIIFFYAQKDETIISSALFLYNDVYMHYHLGGTLIEGRKYAPFNLLIRTAARWANENNIRELHLGGGMESEDTLYRFKRNFNPSGAKDFYIGSTIFDKLAFDELVELRKLNDKYFNVNTPFMITYRAPNGEND